MYYYGRKHQILNPRAETLGESLAILFDVADGNRAKSITENNPLTPYGAAIFYPQIKDMTAYHNNALWPFVASYWALANAKAQNEQGTLQAIGSVFRPAALFATNKENFNLDNGDIATELNSSNMLWSLSGNIAITTRILFGINFEKDGLSFNPFVPKALSDTRTLKNFKYRNATLNITVEGYGSHIKSFTVNGKEQSPKLSTKLKGNYDIKIVMDNVDIEPLKVNNVGNAKAPLTPITWLSNAPELNGKDVPANNLLLWNPIEYIDHYVVIRDGKEIATTRQTSYPATIAGEYQVIGVDGSGIQSFASEPRDNYETTVIEMPDETVTLASTEVSYQPNEAIQGFHGKGFIEVDHSTKDISVPCEIKADGKYAISFVYANGNGPVNTENKCAIRTISIDNAKAGVIVMPHRGVANWSDWGETNAIITDLSAGSHNITISFRTENENMNLKTNHAIIDRIIIKRL